MLPALENQVSSNLKVKEKDESLPRTDRQDPKMFDMASLFRNMERKVDFHNLGSRKFSEVVSKKQA